MFALVLLGFLATDVVASAGALAARRAPSVQYAVVAASDQSASVTGQLPTAVARTVVLQRLDRRWWREVARTRSSSTGAFTLKDPVARSATYRLVAPRWRISRRKRLPLIVSSRQAFAMPVVTAPVAPPPVPLTDALVRAQSWLDAQVPYSQSRTYTNQYGTYRTDCSGFASMVWGLPSSYTTRTLPTVGIPITRDELAPGDILNSPGYHTAVFAGWVDDTHTSYWAYEQSGSKYGMVYRQVPYPYWNNVSTFVPLRRSF